MAFDFRKKWKVWVLLGILVVVIAIAIYLAFNESNVNDKRFVDSISKITSNTSKTDIENAFNDSLYAYIIFKVDSPEYVDSILASLSEEEFKLADVSITTPKLVSGNATKVAILKLEKNKHVLKIYYSHTSEGLLQVSVPLIKADEVWNLGLTGTGKTICVVDSGINYSSPDLGGCKTILI